MHCTVQCSEFLSLSTSPSGQTPSPAPWATTPLGTTRGGKLRTQKLKSHLVRAQSLNVLPLKPGVGQCIATHATLTARDFFLAYCYPSCPFTCIFFQNLSRFLLRWLWLRHGSCVDPQNKIGHPTGGRFSYLVPAEYK